MQHVTLILVYGYRRDNSSTTPPHENRIQWNKIKEIYIIQVLQPDLIIQRTMQQIKQINIIYLYHDKYTSVYITMK